MQKRGQIAVFLVVLFIAAIGIAVMLSGQGATGMSVRTSWWDTPASLPNACGKVCLRNSDCSGQCSLCSISMGRCVAYKNATLSGRYSWSNYLLCQQKCNRVKQRCGIAAHNSTRRAQCASDLQFCMFSCDTVNIPKGQAAVNVR